MAGQRGLCGAGAKIEISSYCLHHGEEPVISGAKGSGTIFFTHCSLRCVFCQNYQISQGASKQQEVSSEELSGIILQLQKQGAHNINLVSPTHYGPQIVEALKEARANGLKLPVVWNSSGYDSLELLEALDGLVDIYLPDFKYGGDAAALKYSGAKNYFETAKAAIFEMFRQVGDLALAEDGIARRGLIVRHLVLPGGLADSRAVLDYLALSPDLFVSLMAQYSPRHRAAEFPELATSLTAAEYNEVVTYAGGIGLDNLFVQDPRSNEAYLPDFEKKEPFGQ